VLNKTPKQKNKNLAEKKTIQEQEVTGLSPNHLAAYWVRPFDCLSALE
jgi:hypothetical protein